jgi:RNA polymerase sigma factor (sigma-70 family)
MTADIEYDELIEQCKQGRANSHQQLYHKYAKAMYNTSLRIVNNVADAEDVLQEAFVDAFKHLNDFKYRSSFGAWLKRIVINKSINLLRKKKRQFTTVAMTDNTEPSMTDEVIDETAFEYKIVEVYKAINLLPEGYRMVVNLYLLEEISQEEIGILLGISHSTVRTQYHRAKQKIVSILKQGGVV